MRRVTTWFQNRVQQSVFMKMGTLRSISRTGATQAVTKRINAKSESEKYFEVGTSTIGEGREVGG